MSSILDFDILILSSVHLLYHVTYNSVSLRHQNISCQKTKQENLPPPPPCTNYWIDHELRDKVVV